jgi:arylsulfatase A-like enzyme
MNRLFRIVLLAVGTSLPGGFVAAEAAARHPNIVFFLCDDLGPGDVAACGGKDILTPNIDSLFARGTRLPWHWSGCAVCAPSRCVLMTGKHPGHAVVRSNREVKPEGQAPMPAGTVTLTGILHDAGYATGGFGKWGLGAPGSVSDPVACGFDRFYGYNCQREAHSFYPDHLWDNRERASLDNPSLAGDPAVARSGKVSADPPPDDAAFAAFSGKQYSADLIAEQQLAFIRDHADQPFFLYVPTTVPHLALQVPADEPSLAHYQEHFGDEAPYLGGRGYVPCRRPLSTYAAMVTRMDREVGRIVKLLDERGLTDDTIFVFTSDNGASSPGTGGIDTERLDSNGPYRDWKGSPYEGGLRAPTAIVWPGHIAPGRSLEGPTGFEDWLPTLLELAGLRDKIPADADGVNMAAALTGESKNLPERVLYRELTEGQWQTVTDGRWKAIRKASRAKQAKPVVTTALFDLLADPAESRDVATKHPDVVTRLEGLMDREHEPHADWPMPFADEASRKATGRSTSSGLSTGAFMAATAALTATPEPAKRPNILFILVDDQSPFDLKAYDPASKLDTPVIDSLAARGVVLDAAYHMGSFSGAVCSPSRHMIMTGRSLWHLPIGPGGGKAKTAQRREKTATDSSERHCPADIEDHVLASVFNAAGYDTMRTCKQGNSYDGANKRFTVRHDATKRGGTAEGGSAWHADRVLEFLSSRESSHDTDPFLIYYGFSHPHDTRDGTPELLAKYAASNHTDASRPPSLDPRQPPLPLNWLPKHPFDNTDMDVRDEKAVSGVWRRRDEATIRNELGREFACSENIDIQIGRVLDKLRESGELDNTWIIYTADHGMAIGRHGLQGKQNLYEPTWRVPLIVAGPGVKAGTRAPGNVYLADVMATLCDIAGIEPPKTNEGKSFLPVLEGEKPTVRDVLYGVYCGGAKPGIRSVRKGDWKLVKYESPAGSLVTQLFDLNANPNEYLDEHHDPAVTAISHAAPKPDQKNLADDKAHAGKRAEMEALLLAEMKRHHDPYRFSDQPALESD